VRRLGRRTSPSGRRSARPARGVPRTPSGFTDLDLVRSYARAEAARLGRELNRTRAAAHSFADRLGAVLADHTELLIEFECPDLPDVSEPAIQAFCGATNEALTNVRKHAHANRVRVSAQNTDGILTVTIADKGVGFDQSTVRGGFGMRVMPGARRASSLHQAPVPGSR
jgi:signal transduction histidine kinase